MSHVGHMASGAGDMPDASNEKTARALRIAAWLTGIYFFIELGIGIWTGSVAVLSDAFHSAGPFTGQTDVLPVSW